MDDEKRNIRQGNRSIYVEQGNVTVHYGKRQIKKMLGTPPFFPEVFIGREDDLAEVRRKLFAGDNLLLLVNGEGGIGKTSLAAVYYRTHFDDYTHLAWVFAESNMLDALLTLALPLELRFPETMPGEQRLGALLEALRELRKPCLLVIDNANRPDELARYYADLRRCPNFHLLVTTRITEFGQAAMHAIRPLPETEAFDLFRRYCPGPAAADDALLRGILAAVGYNTLVIELLAKNLREFTRLRAQYSLAALLADLQGRGLLALQKTGAVSTAYHAAGSALRRETPEAIIAAMYDLGELAPAEAGLLAVFAALPAENIPFDTLAALLAGGDSPDDALLALTQKGWLEFDDAARTFKVSPVVQEVTRVKHPDLPEACRRLISNLLEKLAYEAGTGHFRNASYAEAADFTRYAESVAGCLKTPDNDLAVLCERIGSFHQTTGNLEKALTFFEERSRLGKELYEAYPQNVSFKNGLAISYWKLGDFYRRRQETEKARQYFRAAEEHWAALAAAFPAYAQFGQYLAIVRRDLEEL